MLHGTRSQACPISWAWCAWRAAQCHNLLRDRQLLDAEGHVRPDMRSVPVLRALQRDVHSPAAATAAAAEWQWDLPSQG